MIRHLSLWGAFIRNCLIREMSFRISFIFKVLFGSMWFCMNMLMFLVVFSHVKEVAGWTKYEVFFLMGVSHVILRLFETFFMENLTKVPDIIRQGELDFYLIKPVSPQFLVSTRYASFDSLIDTILGFVTMVYALVMLKHTVTAADVAAFVLLAVNGVMLYYAIMMIAVTFSFWFLRFQVMEVWWQMTNIARQPADIFTGKLRFIFTYCLPMLIIANFPVKAYLARLPWYLGLYGLGIMVVMVAGSTAFFTYALKRYRSASS